MPDPHPRVDVPQPIGPDHVIPVTNQLEDEEILAVGQDEGALLAERGVESGVQPVTVLIDEFILDDVRGHARQPVLRGEGLHRIRADANEVGDDRWRSDRQSGHLIHREVHPVIHDEERLDVVPLDGRACRGIQVGDGQHVILSQDLVRDAELLGLEPHQCHPAPFAVAAVAHLVEGPE